MNMNRNEIEAEINARRILLRQSQDAMIAHLECIVSAMLAKLAPEQRAEALTEMKATENLTADEMEIVRLMGESDTGVKSKRQIWREELAMLEAELENGIFDETDVNP